MAEMAAYATVDDYAALYPDNPPSEAELLPILARACDEVDAMTFGRIRRAGFDGLTPYQQLCVKKALCAQVHFHLQNDALLQSGLANYSINGVSMGLREGAVLSIGGVDTCGEVQALLRQTGLSWRGLL